MSKKSITKYDKWTLIIAGLSLAISLGSYLQFDSLSKKANSLIQRQNELQENVTNIQYELFQMTNFNTTIDGGEKHLYLESINFRRFENGTMDYVILRGNLTTTIIIITPHYGRAEMILSKFNRWDMDIYKEGMEKWTEVKFVRQPNFLYTFQGLNTFKVNIPLACMIYPTSELLTLSSQSKPFIIGDIDFEIIFHDMQKPENVTFGFNTQVDGIINMPIS